MNLVWIRFIKLSFSHTLIMEMLYGSQLLKVLFFPCRNSKLGLAESLWRLIHFPMYLINMFMKKLMWKSLEYRYTKHICTMVYKILNNLTPNYMTENITFKTSDYALRSNQNLNLPKPKTNSCKRTFFYRAVSCYNQLPIEIRNAATLRSFNILLNDHLERTHPWTNFAIRYEYDCFLTINVPWGYCLIRFNIVFVLFCFCFCF